MSNDSWSQLEIEHVYMTPGNKKCDSIIQQPIVRLASHSFISQKLVNEMKEAKNMWPNYTWYLSVREKPAKSVNKNRIKILGSTDSKISMESEIQYYDKN